MEAALKQTLITNIGELLTLTPLAAAHKVSGIVESDLGKLKNAWLLLESGKVKAFGPMPYPAGMTASGSLTVVNAQGGLLMPGLVDSHTHLLFAGDRTHEFAARLAGKTYQEIAAAGGGIQATVRASRAASDKELQKACEKRLAKQLAYGITTVEVKSGYGLSVSEEIRHLRILAQVKRSARQRLSITCLALHGIGPEFATARAYVDALIRELLPVLRQEKLADAVDAFIEQGYFSPEDCHEFMLKARSQGLAIRLHADEFSNARGAHAAAQWGARSADHLQHADEAGLRAMAKAGVVATVLPGTSLYTAIPFVDARRLLAAGCAVALASDFNPGSCFLGNLPLIASVGGLHCKLTPWQILAGITFVPACSLGFGKEKGALAPGYDGDFVLHQASSLESWLADMGQTPPESVWIKGEKVWGS